MIYCVLIVFSGSKQFYHGRLNDVATYFDKSKQRETDIKLYKVFSKYMYIVHAQYLVLFLFVSPFLDRWLGKFVAAFSFASKTSKDVLEESKICGPDIFVYQRVQDLNCMSSEN
jgi:hypothetical protein